MRMKGMAPERQDKDKYTHAEVRFEHPARARIPATSAPTSSAGRWAAGTLVAARS